LGSLPELGKLTGAREATGASDADRGYRRVGVIFNFFLMCPVIVLAVFVKPHAVSDRSIVDRNPHRVAKKLRVRDMVRK